MVTQHNTLVAENLASGMDASVAGMIGQDKIIVQGARCIITNGIRTDCSCQSFVCLQFSLPSLGAKTGMLKALPPAPADAHTNEGPSRGDVEAVVRTAVNDA